MKVVFANAPAFFFDEHRRYLQGGCRFSPSNYVEDRSKLSPTHNYVTFPFELAYTHGYLSREIPDVELAWIDGVALNMNQNEWVEHILKVEPDFLIVQGTTSSFNYTIDLLRRIKLQTPAMKIAVGGWHASGAWEEILSRAPWIDFALIQEFEDTVLELVKNELNPTDIKGIAHTENGRIHRHQDRPTEMNIDKYPWPYREKETIGRYYDAMRPKYGVPSIQMWTSRGCPTGCIFCFSTIFYERPTHRTRNVKDVVDEMEYCKKEFNAKQFYFDDDTVTLNPKHLKALCSEIKSRGDFVWSCMGDVTLTRENLRAMRGAGCVAIKFGVETIKPEAIHKTLVTPDRAMNFRRMCKEEGMWVHGQFMLGFPHDTIESLKATLKYIEKMHPDTFQIYGASPLPGTPFYKVVKEKGWLITDDWDQLDAARPLAVSYPWLSNKEIYDFVQKGRRINERFYARYVLRKAAKDFIRKPRRIFSGDIQILRFLRQAI